MEQLSPEQKQTLEERWNGCVFDEHDLRRGMLPGYSELGVEGLRLHLEVDADGVPSEEQMADLVVIMSLEVGITTSGKLMGKPTSAGERMLRTIESDEQLIGLMPMFVLYMKYLKRFLQKQDEEAATLLLYMPTPNEQN